MSGADARNGGTAPEILALLMPSSVFLDDDIASLLGVQGGSSDAFLSIVVIPERSWNDELRQQAVARARTLAHEVTLVRPELAPRGRGSVVAYVQDVLSDVARRCPPGGTVVLGWPGSTEDGVRFLRLIRARFGEANGLEVATTPEPLADDRGAPLPRLGEPSHPF